MLTRFRLWLARLVLPSGWFAIEVTEGPLGVIPKNWRCWRDWPADASGEVQSWCDLMRQNSSRRAVSRRMQDDEDA